MKKRFALYVLIAACLYGPSLSLPVGPDTPEYLEDARKVWSGDWGLTRAERPVTTAWFVLWWPVLGERPEGWRALSILLHVVCAMMVGKLSGPNAEGWVAALFLICVSGSQAVLWPGCVGYELGLIFALLAIGGGDGRDSSRNLLVLRMGHPHRLPLLRYACGPWALWTLAGLAHPILAGVALWRIWTSVKWRDRLLWTRRVFDYPYPLVCELRPAGWTYDLAPIACLVSVAACAWLFPGAPQWSASRLLLEPETVALDAGLGWMRPVVNLLWYAGMLVEHAVYPFGTFLDRPGVLELVYGAGVLAVFCWRWPKWALWLLLTVLPVIFEPSVYIGGRYLYLPSVALCVVTGQALSRFRLSRWTKGPKWPWEIPR